MASQVTPQLVWATVCFTKELRAIADNNMSLVDLFAAVSYERPCDGVSAVAYHRKSYREWLSNYRALVVPVRDDKRAVNRPRVLGLLPNLVSDERNLYEAWRVLSGRGSATAGPNDLTWGELSWSEMWEQLRYIRDVIRDGEYVHGRVQRVRLPKSSGVGFREIRIADIQDRVIARAVQQILEPWLEPDLQPLSCCRARRGPPFALALAELLTRRQKSFAWGCQDLRDAFEHVPRQRMVDLVRRRVPSEPLIGLIEQLLGPPARHGVPQGSPLSSLLFEHYRGLRVDRPWRREFPRNPLITYADDLLVLADVGDSSAKLGERLAAICQPAGFAVKHQLDGMFVDVRDAPVEWLGFRCQWQNNRLTKVPLALSWRNDDERGQRLEALVEKFAELHRYSGAHRRAVSLVKGVINSAGPGYCDANRPAAYELLTAAAAQADFDEPPSVAQLEAMWKRADYRWRKTVERAKESLRASSLGHG